MNHGIRQTANTPARHHCLSCHVLTPGRYVGAEPQEDYRIAFEEKMAQLTAQWREQQEEARRLDEAVADKLKSLEFWSSVYHGV